MTLIAGEPLAAPPRASPGLRARLGAVIATHSVVDTFSFIIVPLMPLLAARLDLTPVQIATVLGLGSISSGVIQPLVAWASDRFDTRKIGTIGFAVAVVAIGLLGQVTSFQQLLVIQLLGQAGIGAFHPPAAALVGQMSGARRSMGIATFYAAGMIGGVLGNMGTPIYVKHLGIERLAALIVPGLLFVLLLAVAAHSLPHRHADAHTHHRSLPRDQQRERWIAVGLLYFGNIMRFTVNMALIQLFIQWSTAHTLAVLGLSTLTVEAGTRASGLNGWLQGAMQLGMGLAGLGAGWFVRTRHERRTLVLGPSLGALSIAAFPFVSHDGNASVAIGFVLAMLAGAAFGGVIPTTIALAQRLLPHRTGLASGLMMGGAWAFAAVGPALAQWLADRFGLREAFIATAALLLLSGLLSMLLPGRAIRDSAGR